MLALIIASTSWFPITGKARIIFGLAGLGIAMMNMSRITPDSDFTTLVIMRCFQATAGAFVFVPLSTISYATLPRSQLRDATCLFSMTRNIISSVGVSVTTALVVQRSQDPYGLSVPESLTPFNFRLQRKPRDRKLGGFASHGHDRRITPSTAAGGQFYQTLDSAKLPSWPIATSSRLPGWSALVAHAR